MTKAEFRAWLLRNGIPVYLQLYADKIVDFCYRIYRRGVKDGAAGLKARTR